MNFFLKGRMLISFSLCLFFAFIFNSCADFSEKDSASISLSLSPEVVRAVGEHLPPVADGGELGYKVDFSLSGLKDYKIESKEYSHADWDSLEEKLDKDRDGVSYTFDNLPVGSKVKVDMTVSVLEGREATPLLKGESEEKEIQEGQNFVSLKLKFIGYDLIINMYLNDDGDYVLSSEYSARIKSSFDSFDKDFDEFIAAYEIQYAEKSCFILGEKAYIPNESKLTGALIDTEKFTITIDYYLDRVYLADGQILVESPAQKYTLTKDSSKSTTFCLNGGKFVFKLVDQKGNDVLSDIDWNREINQEAFMTQVEFRRGNNVIEGVLDCGRNEVELLPYQPLLKSGIYQLSITLSPVSKEYVNTAGETVALADFEPISGLFEINVEESYAIDISSSYFDPADVAPSNLVPMIANAIKKRSKVLVSGTTASSFQNVFNLVSQLKSETVAGLIDLDMSGVKTSSSEEGSRSVASYIFQDWTNLASVKLPQDLEELTDGVFKSCTALESVTFGSKIKAFSGGGVFNGCTSLTSITIPASVTQISPGTFVACSSLTNIEFEVSTGWYRFSTSQTLPITEWSGGSLLNASDLTSDSFKNGSGSLGSVYLYRKTE